MRSSRWFLLVLGSCLVPGSSHARQCEGNYLNASGNRLYDVNGNQVQLTGVNWFGFETSALVFHGLWTRDHKSMLQQIKDLGFNSIRVPWCNAMLAPGASVDIDAYGTDPYTGVSPMNEEESTKTHPLEIMDIMVQWCQENDLKIILDNHSRNPDGYAAEELWYTSSVPHEQWVSDWVFMAERYRDYDAVIAMDINNEPHGNYGNGARWGSGDPANDWRLAAQDCGNAILAVNPDVLIMVEGVEEFEGESYWWGGNLKGADAYPVVISNPSKLVYSPHEYGPTVYPQPWFSDPSFPGNMPGIWEANFNYLHTGGVSPLFMGEFGIRDQGGVDEVWFDTFLGFMADQGHHWAFWCMNPNSGDTGGILDDDWATVVTWKYNKLQPHLAPAIPNCSGTIPVSGVAVSPASLSLQPGESATVVAAISPADASNRSVIWSSNNSSVATVTSSGVVTGQAAGSAVIKATTVDGGFSDTCSVTTSGTCVPTDITPHVRINDGSWNLTNQAEVAAGDKLELGPHPTSGGSWSWTGPSGFSATTRQVTLDNVQTTQAGNYIASFTNDCGADSTETFVVIVSGGGGTCDSPALISVPIDQDGAGEFCWVTSDEIGHVNSWNLDLLEVNGVGFTNQWSDNMPPRIGGSYYIHYRGAFPWSHFEARP